MVESDIPSVHNDRTDHPGITPTPNALVTILGLIAVMLGIGIVTLVMI